MHKKISVWEGEGGSLLDAQAAVTYSGDHRDDIAGENGGSMKRSRSESVHAPAPVGKEIPKLDERLWRAWKEKNAKLDNMRFVRRTKMTAILVAVLMLLVVIVQIVTG